MSQEIVLSDVECKLMGELQRPYVVVLRLVKHLADALFVTCPSASTDKQTIHSQNSLDSEKVQKYFLWKLVHFVVLTTCISGKRA
ncbi:hypothetical protein VNO78_01716 [Psophocarpus tetragonolobus]|uniref:Uncharacterized protein n=1 Tax=Psophocarpus tetragonolobus TaxID=3891 RepID=A0AAN9T9S2_PSOTE